MKCLFKTFVLIALAVVLVGCNITAVSSENSSEQVQIINASQVAEDVLQKFISLGGEFAPDFKGIDELTCKNLCLYYLRWCRVSGVDINNVWEEQSNGSFALKKDEVDQFANQYFYGYSTDKFKESEYLYLPPTLPAVDSKNCNILSYSSDENIVIVRIESVFELPSDFNTENRRTSTVTVTATVDNGIVKIINGVSE